MTIMLVNRSLSQATDVQVAVTNFPTAATPYKLLRLANLPAGETFRSHTDNALQADSVTLEDGAMNLSLPPLSVTAVLLWNDSGDDPAARGR
jgi:alpha-L-arabinofuranosidase